jgi:hypothetical protein
MPARKNLDVEELLKDAQNLTGKQLSSKYGISYSKLKERVSNAGRADSWDSAVSKRRKSMMYSRRSMRIIGIVTSGGTLSHNDRIYVVRHKDLQQLLWDYRDEKEAELNNARVEVYGLISLMADNVLHKSSSPERRATELLRDFEYSGDRDRLFGLVCRYFHYEEQGIDVSASKLGRESGILQPNVNPLLRRVGLKEARKQE